MRVRDAEGDERSGASIACISPTVASTVRDVLEMVVDGANSDQ
jgi:hypothetical protein